MIKLSVGVGVGALSGLRRAVGPSPSFITTWDTTGASETVTLPATSTVNNFTVDWGDGSGVETVTTASPTHVYAVADTYIITIAGTCPTWSFNNGGNRLKIKDVSQWGDIGLTNLDGGFYGCSNMTTSATDAGGFSRVTHMGNLFRSAVLADPVMTGWDVSSVTLMYRVFQDATIANPDISNLDISVATNMTSMMSGSAFSNANYDLALAAWSLLSVQSSVAFHAGIAKYTEVAARAILTGAPNNWVITDGGPA